MSMSWMTDGTGRAGGQGDALLAQVLDGLAQGVVVLDERARLVHWNLAAEAALQQAGWTLHQGSLLPCKRLADEGEWVSTLLTVCRDGLRHLLDLSDDDGPWYAALMPVREGTGHAMLVLGRRETCGALELQLFASHHGLTHAESAVLGQLARGLRGDDIALAHGVARTTVLTQIAAVRSKTRSRTVGELMRHLSRMPFVRPAMLGLARTGLRPRWN